MFSAYEAARRRFLYRDGVMGVNICISLSAFVITLILLFFNHYFSS